MAKKKTLSEGRMHDLWRKSVLIKCNHNCYLCGRYGDENLDCHHIIRRVKKLTRWNWKNGVCLCRKCHNELHQQNKVKRQLENTWEHIEELDWLNVFTYKDYLISEGISHNEYYKRLELDMKDIIKNG